MTAAAPVTLQELAHASLALREIGAALTALGACGYPVAIMLASAAHEVVGIEQQLIAALADRLSVLGQYMSQGGQYLGHGLAGLAGYLIGGVHGAVALIWDQRDRRARRHCHSLEEAHPEPIALAPHHFAI